MQRQRFGHARAGDHARHELRAVRDHQVIALAAANDVADDQPPGRIGDRDVGRDADRLDRSARQVVAACGRPAQQHMVLVDERDRAAPRLRAGREVEHGAATESVAAIVDQRVHRVARALAVVVEQAIRGRVERFVQRERGLQLALPGERGDRDGRGAACGERRPALEPAAGDAQARRTASRHSAVCTASTCCATANARSGLPLREVLA